MTFMVHDNTGTANMPDGKVANAGTAAQLDAYMDDAQKDFKQTNPNGESIRVQAERYGWSKSSQLWASSR